MPANSTKEKGQNPLNGPPTGQSHLLLLSDMVQDGEDIVAA